MNMHVTSGVVDDGRIKREKIFFDGGGAGFDFFIGRLANLVVDRWMDHIHDVMVDASLFCDRGDEERRQRGQKQTFYFLRTSTTTYNQHPPSLAIQSLLKNKEWLLLYDEFVT